MPFKKKFNKAGKKLVKKPLRKRYMKHGSLRVGRVFKDTKTAYNVGMGAYKGFTTGGPQGALKGGYKGAMSSRGQYNKGQQRRQRARRTPQRNYYPRRYNNGYTGYRRYSSYGNRSYSNYNRYRSYGGYNKTC